MEQILSSLLPFTVYPLVAAAIYAIYGSLRRRGSERSVQVRQDAVAAGLTEPASLHPVIDPARCIGCASCVYACPEALHEVLGIVDAKAQLINPTHCIGHGACRTACPMDAITLVFGTEKRGVDIPLVKPNFETNVPGMFIAGELGGMGLIRNAIEQGRQAMEAARKLITPNAGPEVLDVLIVGAGPSGFSASLTAMSHKLKFRTIEQDSLGGTVAHFPRGKLVMTKPVQLPMVGEVKFTETTKEELLAFWESVVAKTGLQIQFQERIESIERGPRGFTIKSTRGNYEAQTVMLCIGRRGTPRTLDVKGENMNKVVYRLIDPEQYRGQHVLVVGGGDSALEAATSIAAEPGTTVTISYRSDGFGRAKDKNRKRVAAAEQNGRLQVLLRSGVKEITETHVRVEQDNVIHNLPNDAVIVCAGGILPTAFLKECGIEVETKYGTA
ncbi:MAG: NAD(P)-binding domain-containing protein [Gammaproteobacteria bacterium]|nr:NAD(P)-binding domain-containing protein [Gammaproteobacteria bacterium]MBI5615881.1 NAD(P)-binding domain-containing protein [Gammaproteobacteria bacterium]